MNVSVNPIFPLADRRPDEGIFRARKPIDLKVRGLVLDRISRAKGGLFPSAAAPQIVIDLIPAFEMAKMEPVPCQKRKANFRKAPLIRRAPIGLRAVDPEGWLNALMQLIIFIPGFAELFFFSPRSFSPFQEFIDQYYQDQQEGKALSSANGIALFRFLKGKLPSLCLHEIFQFLIRVLNPKWQIYKNIQQAFENGISADLFVTESSLKKQVFTEPDLFCYDLDAFIELRPDGLSANFITYVKVDGMWYQCDDERITQLRSNHLNAPLQRAILLHYKKIDFGMRG